MGSNDLISKLMCGKLQGMDITSTVGAKKSVTKIAGDFADYMSNGSQKTSKEQIGFIDEKKAKDDSGIANDSFDRYQSKTSRIDVCSSKDTEEKIQLVSEEMKTVEKEIVDAVCEQLEVSEDDVLDVMQMMGISPMELLDPQKLAQFTVELIDVEDTSALLLDSKFQSLLANVAEMGDQLMSQFGMNMEQISDLMSKMEMVEPYEISYEVDELIISTQTESEIVGNEDVMPQIELDALENGADGVEKESLFSDMNVIDENQGLGGFVEDSDNILIETAEVSEISFDGETDLMGRDVDGSNEVEFVSDNQMTRMQENREPLQQSLSENTDSSEQNGSGTLENNVLDGNSSEKSEHVEADKVVSGFESSMIGDLEMTENISQVNGQQESYVSVDTIKVIEQIVEKVRVTNLSDMSSIEMQLNPANLGKIYLNVSSNQSGVTAQVAVTNEVVKEALEAQIVELKENLSQAGVKVDAIEVTVATHEFERNLEQGQSREEQEGELQEEMKSKNRKGINFASDDELDLDMTEEEILVAKIMRDNGNSIDFMA